MAGCTVQDILRRGFGEFSRTHRLPGFVYRAAYKMMNCRTRALGGHVQRCPHGHVERAWYNSCKHRSCPQCSLLQLENWLARQKSRLIACDHYHVVFTTPPELHTLWRYNRSVLARLLFSSVNNTLLMLLADPKYLGATPGILSALHTWGRTLQLHPHIHCLVTGGGVTERGSWRKVRKDCLLPRKVLMMIFRGKYLDAIRKAADAGELRLPPKMTVTRLNNLLNKLGRATWNVKILEKYRHGDGVLTYLARYVRGGPIRNRRLVSCRDGEVRFRYRSHRDVDSAGRPREKVMSLSIDKFLERLLQHVPPQRTQVVRGCGLYANSKSSVLEQARSFHGQEPIEMPPTISWQDLLAKLGDGKQARCPVCQAILERSEIIAPCRGPPYETMALTS